MAPKIGPHWAIYSNFVAMGGPPTMYDCHIWSSRTIYGAVIGPPLPQMVPPCNNNSGDPWQVLWRDPVRL